MQKCSFFKKLMCTTAATVLPIAPSAHRLRHRGPQEHLAKGEGQADSLGTFVLILRRIGVRCSYRRP
jgi:hypothetical protein